MSDQKKTYEGMFLLPAGESGARTATDPVKNILEKNQARVLSIKPWDERRLAYDIRGHKRGLYVLSYFEAPTDSIPEIEHDCRLDERILRVLILRREQVADDEISADSPATAAQKKAAERQARAAETKPPEPEPAKVAEVRNRKNAKQTRRRDSRTKSG